MTALVIACLLFVYKWRDVRKYKGRFRSVDIRWLFWYNSIDIFGTASNSRRAFMQTQNKLSTMMWLCVAVGILLFLFPF